MSPDERFMRVALRTAAIGVRAGQSPFGVCLVRDDGAIVRAHNMVWAWTDPTAHAEVVAIRRACRRFGTIDLGDVTLYSTTEPCPMCFAAIHWAGIRRIVFGASIEDARRAGFRELTISNETLRREGRSGVEIAAGVLAAECAALLAAYAGRVY